MLFRIQGRYGFQHLGINPGGVMDALAAQLANIVAGNKRDEAVIEMHFPASTYLFEEDALFALGGADFSATINDQPVPLYTPVVIRKYSALQFKRKVEGARCYLAVHGGFKLQQWLKSYSTHLKANAGGMEGRSLQLNDQLHFNQQYDYSSLTGKNDVRLLPWQADHEIFYTSKDHIRICEGPEYNLLTSASKVAINESFFFITTQSDRMGYRLRGAALRQQQQEELVSSAVVNGTIQLLPNGQLIILMADHQTTGGYPRIANVISADLPLLAQLTANQSVQFQKVDHAVAEQILVHQNLCLEKVQNACTLRWSEFFHR
ncbi:MAG: biotin-dependent carboxyltransferase [Chitinophagaceae bacterium]|nr:biotin-dependent carboxyltransferase [Chitinophagaceae bacterium]